MEWIDIVNAMFEIGGGFAICDHIRQLLKDKSIAGVSISATVFFTTWGFWNLYYYPALDQWLSFSATMFIASANFVWLSLMYKYRNNKKYV